MGRRLRDSLSDWPPPQRCRERALNSPAFSEAVVQDLPGLKAVDLRPLKQRPRLAIERERADVSPVPVLFEARGPHAILRTVWAVIVFALNGVVTRRSRSHVGVEGLKRGAPAIADDDSAGTVVREGLVGRAVATAFDLQPRGVFARVLKSMRAAQGGANVLSKTAAAAGGASAETPTDGHNRAPAGAYALPRGLFAFCASALQDFQSSERLPSQIGMSPRLHGASILSGAGA